eukprot:1728953-Amphidinium_carterae.1
MVLTTKRTTSCLRSVHAALKLRPASQKAIAKLILRELNMQNSTIEMFSQQHQLLPIIVPHVKAVSSSYTLQLVKSNKSSKRLEMERG